MKFSSVASLCLPTFRAGRHIGFPLVSVRSLSITKSCPLYNLLTVKDILMKLHIFVKHIETFEK